MKFIVVRGVFVKTNKWSRVDGTEPEAVKNITKFPDDTNSKLLSNKVGKTKRFSDG